MLACVFCFFWQAVASLSCMFVAITVVIFIFIDNYIWKSVYVGAINVTCEFFLF